MGLACCFAPRQGTFRWLQIGILVLRVPLQRFARYQPGIRTIDGFQLHIGGHVRQQINIMGVDPNQYIVSNEIALHAGVHQDLIDASGQLRLAISVDGERDGLPRIDLADIGFTDGGPNSHIA